MPRNSLIEFLETAAMRHARDVAIAHRRGYRTERWTYAELADTASQFAQELERRGVRRGERVLLWGENCAEWAAAFWGCILRGAVAVPMDRTASPEFARRVAQEASVKLAVVSRELKAAVKAAPALVLEELRETVRGNPKAAAAPGLGRMDPAEIIFTSGTTGEPRGVVLTHGNLLANLEPLELEISKYLRYERLVHPLRFLNLLPLSHVFGQFLGLFVPPMLGGTVLFQESLNPSEVMRAIRRERVSVLVAVPRLLDSLRAKIERDAEAGAGFENFQRNLAEAGKVHFLRRWWKFRRVHRELGWKFWALISGGATLDAELENFWRRMGFAVIQGYGMTETTSLVSVNHPFRMGRGSIGKVLPGREMKISENGEILVRGENIASEYWQGGEKRSVVGEDGWLHTGDRGLVDEEGNLFFKGRQKNVIVTREGMNVYPEDLEAELRRQSEIRDCVVVGLETDEPCAVLLLRDESSDAGATVARANQRLAAHQHMRRWMVWPTQDFPRTGTHKPRLDLIQKAAQAHFVSGGGGAAPAMAADSLAVIVARITGRPVGELHPGAGLESDLNLSSIERVELASALEDRYQVSLDESQFTAATTCGELEKLLRQEKLSGKKFEYPRWALSAVLRAARMVFYYAAIWPATMLLAAPRVMGRENLRGLNGPALVVSNHVTYLDAAFLLAALPGRLRHRLAIAMGGERLMAMRDPPPEETLVWSALLETGYALATALFATFPLPQKSGFRESFAFAGECADRGYSVLVFPEGARTPDGKLHAFRAGAGLLASNLNLPIIPMRIDGLWELKAAGQKFARPGAVTVRIGPPQRFPAAAKPEEIARELERQVASL